MLVQHVGASVEALPEDGQLRAFAPLTAAHRGLLFNPHPRQEQVCCSLNYICKLAEHLHILQMALHRPMLDGQQVAYMAWGVRHKAAD